MKKRSDKNSVTSAVVGFAGVIDDDILPPAGVELRSDKECASPFLLVHVYV